MKKQLLILAVSAITISGISSCAKCAVCVNPSKTEKIKVCDKEDKKTANDMIDDYTADGWKCHASNEAI
ncbi:MAG: hypothetical protein KF706_07120 [Chitinophagales bacterium]|nr:hypothetical protein [Chitinophagales bacterium]